MRQILFAAALMVLPLTPAGAASLVLGDDSGDTPTAMVDASTYGSTSRPTSSGGPRNSGEWTPGSPVSWAEVNDEIASVVSPSGTELASPAAIAAFDNGPANAVVGVPEPATWALLLSGFGLIGGALRRRPRSALASV